MSFSSLVLEFRAAHLMHAMGYRHRSHNIGSMPLILSIDGMDAYAKGWDDADLSIRLVA